MAVAIMLSSSVPASARIPVRCVLFPFFFQSPCPAPQTFCLRLDNEPATEGLSGWEILLLLCTLIKLFVAVSCFELFMFDGASCAIGSSQHDQVEVWDYGVCY